MLATTDQDAMEEFFMSRSPSDPLRRVALGAVVLAMAFLGAACSSATTTPSGGTNGTISAVAAENEYASVLNQIGGQYVTVNAVMSNPNTDPHTYESSPQVAQEVSAAQLVIQNGLGYDTFMDTIEAASPSSTRKVIDVQKLLGLPDDTPNPHIWYDPKTMPAVATEIVSDLSALEPANADYFKANETKFVAALGPWLTAMAQFKSAYPNTPVAVTEPVPDDMLTAAGANDMTPWTFQADIMNGVDPSPQDIATQEGLFTNHSVKAFLYNQQVTDSLTQTLLTMASQNGIPVVGVYETMPTPGYTYQSWMLAEVQALQNAVANGTSTTKL